MIFLTVGTTKFPFNRLLKAVDSAMIDFKKKESLIVQKGVSVYQFQYKKADVFQEVPFGKMIDFLKKSRQVICHGGLATVFLALKYGRNKPLVVPRTKKFDEHVDDHQIFFARFLKKREGMEVVFPQEDLPFRIKKYLYQPKKFGRKKETVPSKKLIKKLIDYTR